MPKGFTYSNGAWIIFPQVRMTKLQYVKLLGSFCEDFLTNGDKLREKCEAELIIRVSRVFLHVFLVTPKENMIDMIQDLRQATQWMET
ncbi:hypothetical protein C1H46_038042 [Malus baccata]|uniref:Uncharacterized protein n=1 Tax=Malus baccata TaxID=106549 RepID=A0A540KQA9_MALBA|nr:hypothetical protein C1H46_038042 [Malus baccata]